MLLVGGTFLLILAWIEFRLWTGLARARQKSDLVLLGAMHLALLAVTIDGLENDQVR